MMLHEPKHVKAGLVEGKVAALAKLLRSGFRDPETAVEDFGLWGIRFHSGLIVRI